VRVGDGAANLAVLRHFTLNLFRQERTTKGSLATKRFRVALDEDYRRTVLAGLHQQHAIALLYALGEVEHRAPVSIAPTASRSGHGGGMSA
jgi:hypothetical protein